MAQTLDAAKRIAEMQAKIESGEMSAEDLADTIEGAELELTDKIDAMCALISDFKSNAEQCKEKAQSLQQRQKMWENKARDLRQYLMMCIQASGRSSVKTVFNTVTVKKGRDKIVINVDDLPDEFKNPQVVVTADREKVERSVADGVIPEGVVIEPGLPSLSIR